MEISAMSIALPLFVLGLIVGYALKTFLAARNPQGQDLAERLQAEHDLLVKTQAEMALLETQRLEVRELLARSEEQKRLLDETRSARIRELEVELAQIKASDLARSESRKDLERRLLEMQTEIRNREEKALQQQAEITKLHNERDQQNSNYQKQVSSLVQAQENIDKERARVRELEEQRQLEALEKRRNNWVTHENAVIEHMKNLCKRLEIVYHDKKSFPLQKKPDFTIEIGGQFVVLDAKAPADPAYPENFYDYLKRQAEGLEKYLKQEGVRKEGFLVVPTDALAYLQGTFYFEVASYKIFVVGSEALEPVLRLLLKLEEFEVLQTLGPEAQDDLASFIGQASRMIKRRVQIDHFMSDKFIELLISGESLPEEILKKAQAKEKNYHLNPPKLDRGKPLAKEDLIKKQDQLSFHIERVDINAIKAHEGREALEQIPLNRTIETNNGQQD